MGATTSVFGQTAVRVENNTCGSALDTVVLLSLLLLWYIHALSSVLTTAAHTGEP
jgi:hypothetical protein